MIRDLDELKRKVRAFAEERDWEQYHSPKNLAMALAVEAGELMEHFQWLSQEASSDLDEATRSEVADELADIQIYLVRLADRLGVDLLTAAGAKLDRNAEKYPAEKVRGSSKKYTEYE